MFYDTILSNKKRGTQGNMEIPKEFINQIKEQERNRLQEEFGVFSNEEEQARVLAYNNLKFGDIIIAKRYQTEKQRKNIPAGHGIGPFMVARVDNDSIQCFYASSNEDLLYKDVCNTIAITLGYNLTLSNKEVTTSYFDVGRLYPISLDMFIRKTGQLSKKELIKFKEVIEKYKDKKTEVSDIVIYDKKKYLVYDQDKNNIKLDLLKKCSRYSPIQINDEYYELTNSKIIINKNKKVTFIGKLSDELMKRMGIDSIKEGAIINYYNNLYYVYSADVNTINCIYVKKVGKNKKVIKPANNFILINDHYYLLRWPTVIKLSKDDNYELVEKSTNNENINDRIKRKCKKNKKTLGSNPTPGKQWIVENKYTNELFLIIKTVGENCYLIPYYDLIQGITDNISYDSKNNYKAKFILAQEMYMKYNRKFQEMEKIKILKK